MSEVDDILISMEPAREEIFAMMREIPNGKNTTSEYMMCLAMRKAMIEALPRTTATDMLNTALRNLHHG